MTHGHEHTETLVIGAGQAGLAVGYHLARHGRRFTILDADERVGDAWRRRWPSLRLYTPARFDELPGLPFPGKRSRFPSAGEMADYLEAYATHFELPVRPGVRVERLTWRDGRYVAEAGETSWEADNVVVATGVMQAPVVPELAGELDPGITQLHSADYRSPAQLKPGRVLVVGASHSGADIAFEVAQAGHETVLAGRDTGQLPFSVESRRARLAQPILKVLWTRVMTVDTPLGRKLVPEIRNHGGFLLRVRSEDLAAVGVERVVDRVVGTSQGMPQFADGRVLDVANVVWCTGFRPDYRWIDVPLDYDGNFPVQYRGAVASSPGLYFVGMLFLHSFASMLVLGAGRDAKRVVDQIVSTEANGARPRSSRAGAVGTSERAAV
jgi:putative flavoprotein involved in K+ transport